MNPSIFKAYDIRGVYPQELNETTAFVIGAAFAKYTKAKNIIVGEDARKSSPALRNALVKGILSTGTNVVLAGCATTPLFYFAVASYKVVPRQSSGPTAGIMVTASHNPAKYNGFKLVWGDATPIEPKAITPLITNYELRITNKKPGKIKKINILDEYIKKVLSLIDTKKIRPMKIVIDAGNGMAGATAEKLLKHLPQITGQKLYFDIDMSFPNHEANPLKEETLEILKKETVKNHADLGVAYDGDADRIGFVDEKGNTIRADLVFAALLPELLSRWPKSTILYDLRCSKIVPEIAKDLGGKSQMTRVGHAFIKKQLRKTGAIAAAELSSHFYFKDFFGVECSDLVLLYLLAEMSQQKKPVSEIIAPLQKYFHSGEINFEVRDKDAKIAELEKKYSRQAKKISHLDGLRMDFEAFECNSDFSDRGHWFWFSVRSSNTEPLLRLNVEASNKLLLKEKLGELSALIKK